MFHLDLSASVQVTGSHNPPEFNGFKMSLNKKPFYGQDIQGLYKMIKHMDFEKGEEQKQGITFYLNIIK